MVQEVSVAVLVDANRIGERSRRSQDAEQVRVGIEVPIAVQVIGILARLKARIRGPGRALAAWLHQLGPEQRARRVSLAHEVPVARIAAAHLQRRGAAQARDDLVQVLRVGKELHR